MHRLFTSIGPATLVSAVVGVGCSLVSVVFSETGPSVITLSFNLTLMVALFERVQRDLSRTRGSLEKLTERFESPYMRRLADGLLNATGSTLALMLRPAQEFHNEAEFFHFAEKMLTQLGRGDHVVVACADSVLRWQQSMFLKRWLAANYAAAARGVEFTRILLARQPELARIAFEQATNGIKVLIVGQREVEALPELYRLPTDMGLAVVNRERVYMHWGGSEQPFYGCFLDSRILATFILSVLGALEAHGQAVSPSDDSTPAAA